MTNQTAPHNYRLTDLVDVLTMTQETTAYTATLTLHGEPIAAVTSDGRGGAPMVRFTSSQERNNFAAAAQAAAPDGASRWLPADEQLIADLYARAATTQAFQEESRTVVLCQMPGDGDAFEGGTYRAVKGVTENQLREALRKDRPNSTVWDRQREEFTPA